MDVRRLLLGNLSPAEQSISPWPGRSSSSSSSIATQGGYSLWPAYWLSNTAAAAAVQLLLQLQRRQHQQQVEAECGLTAKICSCLAELHEPLESTLLLLLLLLLLLQLLLLLLPVLVWLPLLLLLLM